MRGGRGAGLNEALLVKAVGKLVRAARRVQAAGRATGTAMTGRRRAATRRAREMAATMRARAQLGREVSSAAIGRAPEHIKPRKTRARFLEFCRYLRSLYPSSIRIAIICDNFSPHLSTRKDQRVGT